MTDLQDAILDRLVGTRVGVNWPDGPLAIAADVIGGSKPVQFGQTDNDRGAKAEIARRLGYPVLLVEAIQGGNRGLVEEDDRRGFAMAVFRLIPVGGKPRRLTMEEQNHIAAWAALRAHRCVCPDSKCPMLGMIERLAGIDSVSRGMFNLEKEAVRTRCTFAGTPKDDGQVGWLTARSTKQQRLLQTITQVAGGLSAGSSMGGWCSIRESARLCASEGGLSEAVACCEEIARRCGLLGDQEE